MHSKIALALGGLLSLATAVPLQQQKRDVVWETETVKDVTTVAVTTTIWLEPGETPPAHYGHGHGGHGKPRTSHIKSTVTVQPSAPAEQPEPTQQAPSPSEAAPAPSTPSVAPAETQAPPPPPPAPKPSGGGHSGSPSGSNGLSGLAASGKSYTGDLTWYDTGLGACGITSGPSDHIVAISEDLFDAYGTANPNENPLCGKSVSITGADGSQYDAKIVDRCTGCALSDLDLSHDFFNIVTNNGDGRVGGMKWSFM